MGSEDLLVKNKIREKIVVDQHARWFAKESQYNRLKGSLMINARKNQRMFLTELPYHNTKRFLPVHEDSDSWIDRNARHGVIPQSEA